MFIEFIYILFLQVNMDESHRTVSASVKRKILRTVGLAQNSLQRASSPSRSMTMPKSASRSPSRFYTGDGTNLSADGRNEPIKAGYLQRKQSGLLQRLWQVC